MLHVKMRSTDAASIESEAVNLPPEMDPPISNVRRSSSIVLTAVLESFRWNGDNEFLADTVVHLETRFDPILPLAFHDVSNTGRAKGIPFSAQASFAYTLKRFVYEDSTT